jgi:hypothetical protein
MDKHSIIEQIKAHGVVAAHTTGRYVDIFNHVPVKVNLATPIYMAKKKIRKGDKVAILDLDENVAFICVVSQADTSSVSQTQILQLEKAKKIVLE